MPVPLAPMLAQLRDEFMLAAQAKGIDLRVVQTNQIVESDPTYLRRIVQNLMSNAIRYTETGRVLVGVRRRGAGRARLQVWDTGPGIPEIEHQAVFQEFHRLGVSASASVGMGLGLAIVDRACAQLGHPIHLDSVVGKGTVFGIDLPPARQWVAKKVGTYLPEQASHEHPSGLMVLLVENAALPPPLQRFRGRGALFAPEADAPKLTFPPNGAMLLLDGQPVTLRLRDGVPPFAILLDGQPVVTGARRRELSLPSPGPGFATLSVIDAQGRSDRVQIGFTALP